MNYIIETYLDKKKAYDAKSITIFECDNLTKNIILVKSHIHKKKVAILSNTSHLYFKKYLIRLVIRDENNKIVHSEDITNYVKEYNNDSLWV